MLDKIMEMVSEDALNAITEKAGVSKDQVSQILPLAGDSLQEGLMSQLTGGNVEGVLGMFKSFTGGELESNDIFGDIKGIFMKKVMTNIGLSEPVARLVADSGMTSIIGNLSDMIQADGDTNNINASSLMNVLGGDKRILGIIAGMVGGNKKEGLIDNFKDTVVDKLRKFPRSSKGGSFDITIKA